MQYRTYAFKALAQPYTWLYTKPSGETATFYNYDTLVYASGGSVSNYEIDNDYMVNNNSTVYLAQKTRATVGQIITLIDDSGAYDLGVVTNVDNESLQILYKPLICLFDAEFLNPARNNGIGASEITYKYDGVVQTGQIIGSYYCTTVTDRYLRLPLFIRTSGGGSSGGSLNTPAIWTYTDNEFNVKDWLVDLFDTHNVVLQFKLVFEATERAYIEILITHNTTGKSRIIKANAHGFSFNQTEESGAKATVCQVIDQDSKALLSTWYLTQENTVTSNPLVSNRLQPYKLTVAEFDSDNDEGVTAQDIAKDALLYSDYNHYINVGIDKDTGLYPRNMVIGDPVLLVPEIEKMTPETEIVQDYSDKVIQSIYTGRKENSAKGTVTFIFGKIRINYTDIMQMKAMKKVRT